MDLVFTVRLGQRYVTFGRNILQQLSPEGYVAGFQSEGPGKGGKAGDKTYSKMATWPQRVAYPLGPWPDLYSYADGASPGLNEGVTETQARCALPYGLLMPPVSGRRQTGH